MGVAKLSPKAVTALLRCADAVSPDAAEANYWNIDPACGLKSGLGLDHAALWLDHLAEHTRHPHFAALAGRHLVETALEWKPRQRMGDRFKPPTRGLEAFLQRVNRLQIGGIFRLVSRDGPFSAVVVLEVQAGALPACLHEYWIGMLEAFPAFWQLPYARVTSASVPRQQKGGASPQPQLGFAVTWSAEPQSTRLFSRACASAMGVVLALAIWFSADGLDTGVRAALALVPAGMLAWLVATCCVLLGRLSVSDTINAQQRVSLVRAMDEVRRRFDESERFAALLRERLDETAVPVRALDRAGSIDILAPKSPGEDSTNARAYPIDLGAWIRALVDEVRHRCLVPPGLVHFRLPPEPVWARVDADRLRYIAKFVLRQIIQDAPDELDIQLELSLQGCAVIVDIEVQPAPSSTRAMRGEARADGWTTLGALPVSKTSSLSNELVNPELAQAYMRNFGGQIFGPERRPKHGYECLGFRIELRRHDAPVAPGLLQGAQPALDGERAARREGQESVEMSLDEIRALTDKQEVPSAGAESPQLSALAAERLQDVAESLLQSVSVLVVAPDQRLRRLIRRTLEQHFHVKTCHDAEAALDVASQMFPDLMVVDMSRPSLIQSQLLPRFAALGARFARSPVVALTEEDHLASSLEYLRSGSGDVLRIPFHPEELVLRVRGLVRAKLWERQLFLAYRDLEAQKAEIEEDLALARSFQRSLLGDQARWKQLGVAVRYEPMLAVGGDLVDVGDRGSGAVRLFVADATDHGVQAALRTASIASFYRRVTRGGTKGPARVMQQLNREMLLFGGAQMTCSAACIELERSGARTMIRVSAAGDVGLALACAAGQSRPLPLRAGLPLGILEEAVYVEVAFDVEDAGYLTVFSDGLTEQPNAQDVTFLEARMPAALDAMARAEDAQQAVAVLSAHFEAFRGVTPPRDDVVIVAAQLAKGRSV